MSSWSVVALVCLGTIIASAQADDIGKDAQCPHFMESGCLLDKAEAICEFHMRYQLCMKRMKEGDKFACRRHTGPRGALITKDLLEDMKACCGAKGYYRNVTDASCNSATAPAIQKMEALHLIYTACAQGNASACNSTAGLLQPVFDGFQDASNTLRELCKMDKLPISRCHGHRFKSKEVQSVVIAWSKLDYAAAKEYEKLHPEPKSLQKRRERFEERSERHGAGGPDGEEEEEEEEEPEQEHGHDQEEDEEEESGEDEEDEGEERKPGEQEEEHAEAAVGDEEEDEEDTKGKAKVSGAAPAPAAAAKAAAAAAAAAESEEAEDSEDTSAAESSDEDNW